MKFDSFKAFNDKFSEWFDRNFHVTRIEDSHKLPTNFGSEEIRQRLIYNHLLITCVHYGKPQNRRSKEGVITRPNMLSFRRECKFCITLRLSDDNHLVIKNINLEHNHPIGPVFYNLYPKNRKISNQEMEQIVQLLDLGVNPNAAVSNFIAKTGRNVYLQDVKNYMLKEDKKTRG